MPNPAISGILAVIPSFLRAVASAPARSSFLTPLVDEILSAAAALIEQGDAAAADLQGLTDQIRAMVSSGRDPTMEEWADLAARSAAAHALIQTGAPSAPSVTSVPPTLPASTSTTPAATLKSSG